MRLDDSLTVQLSDLVGWLDRLAKTGAPSKEVWQEIALSANEHAQFLDNFILPKVVNPAQHWNPNDNETLGGNATRLDVIRASGPRSEAILNNTRMEVPDTEEGVSRPFEAPAG